MEVVVVLVDFDNFLGRDMNKLNPEMMELAFSQIVSLCETNFDEFNAIEIRLYGGWYEETSLTKQASAVQQYLHDVQVFPKVTPNRIINGSIELAATLHEIPGFVWGHTYKESNGVARIRINHEVVDDLCNENRNYCPKFILYKFTQKKDKSCAVDGCLNLHKDVFKGAQQKMVDTLMACDIISVSEDDRVKGILVVSDDQDHFPSLALAATKKKPNIESIVLGIKNNQNMEFISDFLSPFNVKTTLMQ